MKAMESAWTAMSRGVAGVADMMFYPLSASHCVELFQPLRATHLLRARVEALHDETGDARTLTLRPGSGWRRHRAGQHVGLRVAVDGVLCARSYTISSPPERDDGCLTITVKAIAGGRVSRHLVREARIGDLVVLDPPAGDFRLPDPVPARLLFITAGSGITPARCMVLSLLTGDRLPDIVHLHYAPRASAAIFRDELCRLSREQPRYRHHGIMTRDVPASMRTSGHFRQQHLDELCPDWRDRQVYACGPSGLLSSIGRLFGAAGRLPYLHVERFSPYLPCRSAGDRASRVLFARSGTLAQADGQTELLRVAEAAGLRPPHGCRMGRCHACRTTLLAGRVRDLRDGRLIAEPGSAVQLCVCAAAGDCRLEL